MTGLSPFMKHFGDQTVGAHVHIGGTDDEVVGIGVGDLGFFVGGDAFVLIVPFREQETDGATDELGEVTNDEPCVFAGEFDLTTEGEIIANEHTGTGNDTCGELLVMAVPKSKNPAIIITGFPGVNLHQTKIPHSIMCQAVGLGADAQMGGFEGFLDGGDELVVRDGTPGGGWIWSWNFANFLQIDVMSAAMKGEVRCSALDGNGGLGCEICNHGII